MGSSRKIRARGLYGWSEFKGRPLTPHEINRLIAKAKQGGWHSNPDLIDFVLETGTNGILSPRSTRSKDRILLVNMAREIWMLTLKDLAKRARQLAKMNDIDLSIPRITRYKFSDLATPGLLYFIISKMRDIDTESAAKGILKELLVEIKQHGKTLTDTERCQFLDENAGKLVGFVLDRMGLDHGIVDNLPPEVLETPFDRFLAALMLGETLDWHRFNEVYKLLLSGTRVFLQQIALLSGTEASPDDILPIVELPMFPEIIRPVQKIPFEISLRIVSDILASISKTGNIGQAANLSITERKQLWDIFVSTCRSVKENARPASGDVDGGLETATELMISFGAAIEGDPELLRKVCYVYFSAYGDYLKREYEAAARDGFREIPSVPDCFVLVEGPSDKAIFEHAIGLKNERMRKISVIDCGGKASVARRARELREIAPVVGSVFVVLDADAIRESDDLRRVSKGDEFLIVRRFSSGVIENQFDAAFHCKISNELFSGELLMGTDLDYSKALDKSLSRALWKKKQISFHAEKARYARAICGELRGVGDLSSEIDEFVDEILDLAEKRRGELLLRKTPTPFISKVSP